VLDVLSFKLDDENPIAQHHFRDTRAMSNDFGASWSRSLFEIGWYFVFHL